MSNSSTKIPGDRNSLLAEIVEADSTRDAARVLAASLRSVAFWAAVALPFLYLPLLYGGLAGQQAVVFVALLALNCAALVVGHGHRQ